jgi:hypothetical protein
MVWSCGFPGLADAVRVRRSYNVSKVTPSTSAAWHWVSLSSAPRRRTARSGKLMAKGSPVEGRRERERKGLGRKARAKEKRVKEERVKEERVKEERR